MVEQANPFLVRAPRSEPRVEQQPDLAASAKTVHRPVLTSRRQRPATVGQLSGRCVRPADEDATARHFAEHTLRLVLEVIDGKRIPAVLASMLAPGPQSLVRSIARGTLRLPGRNLGTARLHRVTVHRVDAHDVEFFGVYTRGPRHFAIAGRLAERPRLGWQLAALQLG